MSTLPPVAVYGLTVPADDVAVEADGGIPWPATFRITMAAIDPIAKVTASEPARSTLKLVKIDAPDLGDSDEEDDDDDDIEAIERRLGLRVASDDEDEESSDDGEKNGGPSDPTKSKKARAEALIKALKEEATEDEEMEDADTPNGVNGAKVDKGKGKATDDEEDEDDEDEDEDEKDIKEYVICTLDPEKHYQQPLDITINNENEMCYFKVTGPYKVYLTGNFVIPPDADEDLSSGDESDEKDDSDLLLPDEIDDYMDDEESEEDELDAIEDPRVTEVHDDEDEEAPKLVKAGKGKNKRPAEESEEESEDEEVAEDILKKILKPEAPAANGEEKLSKKQKKKLKNNAGEAVPTTAGAEKKEEAKAKPAAKEAAAKDSPASNGKKVQFAKNLEQGPTPTKAESKSDTKPGVKVVNGVTIDDKKIGTGKQAKKGTKVELRYIGKLKDGKVFDANKKGKPFSFKIGSGEVVQGMDIGVQGMAAGGERRITIPARLGYGSKKTGDIPPNSDLIFDIKIISVS